MFGQIVIGPPGSGKTTYCKAMAEFIKGLGRKVAIINLDPANDFLPYQCSVNISELISINDAMDICGLGPNGGLMYCVKYLSEKLDWLKEHLDKLQGHYLLFDCPGQVELYTNDSSLKEIIFQLTSKWNHRLAAVHLVDAHYCSDPAKYISVTMTSLAAMLHVELPHVNVLSKADLIEKFGPLSFNLDFFTEVLDLSYLLDHMSDDPFFNKYKKLNEAMIGIITDFSLVSFIALHVEDKESMLRVLNAVDGANGYVYCGDRERDIRSLLSSAVKAEFEFEKLGKIQEKFIDSREPDDSAD